MIEKGFSKLLVIRNASPSTRSFPQICKTSAAVIYEPFEQMQWPMLPHHYEELLRLHGVQLCVVVIAHASTFKCANELDFSISSSLSIYSRNSPISKE